VTISSEVLLRTTADVLEHAVLQFECCAKEWPEYKDDVEVVRGIAERVLEGARKVGYLGKVRR